MVAIGAVVMVVVQGVLGGLRVDQGLSFSTDRAVTEPNLALAIVHGAFGQAFFAMIALIWAFSTRTWCDGRPPTRSEFAASERTLTTVLVHVVS